jgi:hypothetical protein
MPTSDRVAILHAVPSRYGKDAAVVAEEPDGGNDCAATDMSGRVDQTRIWAVAVGLLHPARETYQSLRIRRIEPPSASVFSRGSSLQQWVPVYCSSANNDPPRDDVESSSSLFVVRMSKR